jgi:hypothetical protein
MPTWSALVARYYTSEPLPTWYPTARNFELECNQLSNQLEHLHNLEQRPSHQSNFQPRAESVKIVVLHVVQQTQPLT